MTIPEAKKEYNKQLKRYNKALEYFDSGDGDNEKYFKDFQKLLLGLSSLLKIIGTYTQEEVWYGFERSE